MIIGEERAVGELWDAAAAADADAARGPPGPARLRDHRAAAGRATPGCARRRAPTSTRLLPACAAAHEEELGVDPLARDAEGFRWRTRELIEEGRSWLWLEDDVIRFKAEASAWTPSARPAPAGLGRPGRAPARLRRAAACATSAGCCSRRRRS